MVRFFFLLSFLASLNRWFLFLIVLVKRHVISGNDLIVIITSYIYQITCISN